jgi:Calcineurin-like phosphoesterase
LRLLLITLIASQIAWAGKFYSYIGQIESRSVLIAWGTTDGSNTIGRDSASMGEATVSLGSLEQKTTKNWVIFAGLEPEHSYEYAVTVKDHHGSGRVRTFPEHATQLRFFVIGDYGTGAAGQKEIASAMTREYERLSSSDDPVRFVITVGDNIYADLNIGVKAVHSGDRDTDWETKFFEPYNRILQEIPFYPSPGNHDGNGTENRADLPVYLDNFFFPGNKPARWYTFQFADLAQFFSLDSTANTLSGRPKPVFLPGGEEFAWFKPAIASSKVPWKIPYFHHPPFNAGPLHGPSLKDLKHFCDEFVQNGVKVVFSGHEHNFQFTGQNAETSGIEYVVSGAGGELRPGDVRKKMMQANIVGWAAERHFLEVEIDGTVMRIHPIGASAIEPVDANGNKVTMPITVKLP